MILCTTVKQTNKTTADVFAHNAPECYYMHAPITSHADKTSLTRTKYSKTNRELKIIKTNSTGYSKAQTDEK